MPAHDFLNASDQELLTRADQCLQRAQSALDVAAPYFDEHTRLRLFLEAQSCIAEVNRRQAEQSAERDRQRTEKIGKRDFWMEFAVIFLILAEIILSIVFGRIAIREGRDQAKVLAHMDTSTATTAQAMQTAAASLQTLATDQAKSLDRLKDMNEELQASHKTTGTMATAARKQLGILQKEQDDRLAQLAKKPELQLYEGDRLLSSVPTFALHPIHQTDNMVTLDLRLTNNGNAVAHKVQVRIVANATDVILISSPRFNLIGPIDPPDFPSKTFQIPLEFVRPRQVIPMALTFTLPKGHPSSTILFTVDAEELDAGTPLATISIPPPHEATGSTPTQIEKPKP